MIESGHVPKKLRRFYVAPLDKGGKNPAKCGGKRPSASLSPPRKLMELVLVRRKLTPLEGLTGEGQYAYQRGRRTEFLLADMDRFVSDNLQKKWTRCGKGLDVAGA